MFEAVGREYWPSYFATLHRQLKPGGKACVQSITIRDDLFERYVRSSDFIQQYIFPGGLLPEPVGIQGGSPPRPVLQVVDELDFGLDYAETLKRWRASFLAEDGPVRQLGFDTRFMRIWEFYLAYCEAAFAAHRHQRRAIHLATRLKGTAPSAQPLIIASGQVRSRRIPG